MYLLRVCCVEELLLLTLLLLCSLLCVTNKQNCSIVAMFTANTAHVYVNVRMGYILSELWLFCSLRLQTKD